MAREKTVQKNPLFNFFLQFIAVGAIFFVIGFSFGQKKVELDRKSFIPRISISSQTPPKDVNIDFSLMWDVLDKLPKEFLDKVVSKAYSEYYFRPAWMFKHAGKLAKILF